MKNRILAILFLGGVLYGQNSYPIVLVHGFLGWGPDEMGDYHYWGGKKDYVQMLRDEGHVVFEISVGPVSSNWDRAVEVYYQLKGGQVDYGKAHSEKFDIFQKPPGKTFEGLYPEWDEKHPVHLIGHSMGGQTVRILQYLLSNEIYLNEENRIPEESDLLGKMNEHWIRSITTISTPHNGATMADVVTGSLPFIRFFIGVAGVVGTRFYDFDLEQWGFERMNDETWPTYVHRMKSHEAWQTKNISGWDLSLDGARELNDYALADSDVYYFSIVTTTTERKNDSQHHQPIKGTSLLTGAKAKLLGSRKAFWSDGTSTDTTWFENDGMVNTCSMFGPTTGTNGADPIVAYDNKDGLLITGQWYYLGPYQIDHWNIIGQRTDGNGQHEISQMIIKNHASRIKLLPVF
jgi:triacylglycerol lipase